MAQYYDIDQANRDRLDILENEGIVGEFEPIFFEFKYNDEFVVSDRFQTRVLERIRDARPHSNPHVYERDDISIAELFATCYQEFVKYVSDMEVWFAYDGKRWVVDNSQTYVHKHLKEFVRLLQYYARYDIPKTDANDNFIKFILMLGDRRARERVVRDAKDAAAVLSTMFDAKPNLINLQDCTLDLDTMTTTHHRAEDMLTQMSNAYWDRDDRQEFPRWNEFLKEISCGDEIMVDYLQRAAGYTIYGDAKAEIMFMLHGKTTRNGKSTFLNAIRHALGDYAKAAPIELIMKKHGNAKSSTVQANPVLARLRGARMVNMSEPALGADLDEEVVKQYTGGEPMVARELYQGSFEFTPQFTMWLSCNDLPTIKDNTVFASNRVSVIEFNKHFDRDEQDNNLKQLFSTQDAVDTIFQWCVEGYKNYYNEGLWTTSDMRKVVRVYEDSNDEVAQFFEEVTEPGEAHDWIECVDVYNKYFHWAKRNGSTPLSNRKFYRSADTLHPRFRNAKRTFFRFIKFRDNEEIHEQEFTPFNIKPEPIERTFSRGRVISLDTAPMGQFDKTTYTVNGNNLTLDEIITKEDW